MFTWFKKLFFKAPFKKSVKIDDVTEVYYVEPLLSDKEEALAYLISVHKDFTPFPAGRYRCHGELSGEAFREDLLIPALRQHDRVKVYLGNSLGYPSAWLDEVFGVLVRDKGYTLEYLRQHLILESDCGMDVYRAWGMIEDPRISDEKLKELETRYGITD